MEKKHWIYSAGIIIALVLIVAGGWSLSHQTSSPLPIDARDHIKSWQMSKPQDGYPKEASDLATAKEMLASATTTPSKYDAYMAIGNIYALAGDGANSYQAYLQAAKVSPTSGLAFVNLGALMSNLGAYATARTAYAKAAELEQSNPFYVTSYLQFLAAHFATDPVTAAAFASAKVSQPNDPNILITEANWLGTIGSTTAAIADWREVQSAVDPAQKSAIEARIKQLQNGQR